MFFGLNIPLIFKEIKSKEKLRKYFDNSEILSSNQYYKIFHFKTPRKTHESIKSYFKFKKMCKKKRKRFLLMIQHQR